jgi:hypothetical protein
MFTVYLLMRLPCTSIWLAAVMQFGLKMRFFKPFEDFNLKMKKVKYSVYQKLITTMMSIVIGCRSTKDINEYYRK